MPSSPRRSSVLERIARGYAAVAVGRVAYGLLLIALIPVVTVLGILVFALMAVVWFGLYTLLGEPDPPLGSILGLAWFGGSLLIVFLVLRRGHRWLTRLIDVAEAPAAWIEPDADDWARPAPDRGLDPAYRERLAAADARHATPSAGDPRDEP